MMNTQTTTTMNKHTGLPHTEHYHKQEAAAAAAAQARHHRRQLHHPYRPPAKATGAAKAAPRVGKTAGKARRRNATKSNAGKGNAAAPVTEASKAKAKAGWAAGAACRARDVRNARKALLAPPTLLEWFTPSKFKGKKGHRALGTARVLAQGAGGGGGVGGGGGASSPDLSLKSCPSLSAGADAAFAKAAAEEQAGFPAALGCGVECGDAVDAVDAVEAVEAVETKEEVAEATALPASPRRAVRGQDEAGEAAAPTQAAPTKAVPTALELCQRDLELVAEGLHDGTNKAAPTKAAAVACQPSHRVLAFGRGGVPVAKVAKATEQSVEKPAKLALLLDLFFKGVLNATEFAEQKARLAA